MQLDYMQISHINKTKEFWKGVQITFFRKRNLSYIQDKGHMNSIDSKKIKRF